MSLPPVPPNTCPNIDEVLETLTKIDKAINAVHWEDAMEELRSSNDALRQNYEHQLERADDLDKELDDVKEERDTAQSRVKELEEELKSLQSQSGS